MSAQLVSRVMPIENPRVRESLCPRALEICGWVVDVISSLGELVFYCVQAILEWWIF
jgi:hypothetical protein